MLIEIINNIREASRVKFGNAAIGSKLKSRGLVHL